MAQQRQKPTDFSKRPAPSETSNRSRAVATSKSDDAGGGTQEIDILHRISIKTQLAAACLRRIACDTDGPNEPLCEFEQALKRANPSLELGPHGFPLIFLLLDLARQLAEFADYAHIEQTIDGIHIDIRRYMTAHHAAFGEARLLIEQVRLAPGINLSGHEQTSPWEVLWKTICHVIKDQLNPKWQSDFQGVPDLLQSESAAAIAKLLGLTADATSSPDRREQKTSKADPTTVAVIRDIQKGLTNEELKIKHGKGPGNIRKIRSQLKNNLYEV